MGRFIGRLRDRLAARRYLHGPGKPPPPSPERTARIREQLDRSVGEGHRESRIGHAFNDAWNDAVARGQIVGESPFADRGEGQAE